MTDTRELQTDEWLDRHTGEQTDRHTHKQTQVTKKRRLLKNFDIKY